MLEKVVLIIDKRKEQSVKYKRILESSDMSVITASDFSKALNLMNAFEPDLIMISDSLDFDIKEAIKQIRVLTYNTRPAIIALSKSNHIQDKIDILDSGADDFLSEPINHDEFKARISGDKSNRERKMRSNYAVAFGQTRGEAEGIVNRKDSIQGSFNSPMRPFVLATTSIGQEGLDFHLYCRKIMHWNLPSNPVELEQREGRINRFKCLAIRENIVQKYGGIQFKDDVWEEMFEAAEAEKGEHQSELIPFWCFGKEQKVKIERLLPFYPMSRDENNYAHLIKILNYYRLTLGQPRQEELLEYVFSEVKDAEKLKQLFIDLSPFSKKDSK